MKRITPGLIIFKILNYFNPQSVRFKGHYEDWRKKRVDTIVNFFGVAFFKGKSILELGCGYGDIGAKFAMLGANVLAVDAREEHLAIGRKRYPFMKFKKVDLDKSWPFEEKFDLIIHTGVLYHLNNFEKNLLRACKSARYLVLETEVCDSSDPAYLVKVKNEYGYDQSYHHQGSRPSAAYIEKILTAGKMRYTRMDSNKLNSADHRYDWKVTGTGNWTHGLRRFWFAERLNR